MHSAGIGMREVLLALAGWSHHKRCDYRTRPFRNNSAQYGLAAPHLLVINHVFNDGPLIHDLSVPPGLKKSTGSGARQPDPLCK